MGNVKTEIRQGTCPVCNNGGCHALVHVRDGQVVKITRDMKSPFSSVCDKFGAAMEYHYHPQRLNYPMKRAGERGEGKWTRITWEQAMDEIAMKLDSIRSRFGPEAVSALGGGNLNPADPAAWRWFNLWGSPNYFWQGKNCGQHEFIAECAIYGNIASTLYAHPTPGLTKCALLWGYNPFASGQQRWKIFLEAKKTGTKLVVIDPRRSGCAEEADIWLRIRPGTDGALALGMMNIIINEGLYDKEFVDKWCIGFDKVKALSRNYPPEKVATITWIPKEQIIEVARLYATSKPAIITGGVGARQVGGQAVLPSVAGKAILRAITGNIDKEGGNLLVDNPEATAYLEEMHWDKLIDHPLRKRDNVSAHVWPAASVRAIEMFRKSQGKVYPRGVGISSYFIYPGSRYIWSAILENDPYPMKAVFLQNSNPLVVLSNGRRIHRALKSPNLELYVVAERWMTPSAQLADYILPAADNLERPYLDPMACWGFRDIRHAREQAVEPLYERRDDWYIWRDLGKRLGQEEYWTETPEEWFDKLLAPTGVTFKELANDPLKFANSYPCQPERYKQRGFATFSGKVELASSFFKKLGLPALSEYSEPPWSPVSTPELAREFPLILISGARTRTFFHSQHKQIETLRKKYPFPLLDIHPETARKLGIEEGDTVHIETPLGSIRQKAHLVESLDPRVVHADGYWWYPELPPEEPCLSGVWDSNINAIIPDDPELCDYAGNNYLRALLCRVYKAKEF